MTGERKASAAAVLAAALLASCALLKARPAETSSFLPHGSELREERGRIPLDGVWFGENGRFYQRRGEFSRLWVAPVDVSRVEEKIERSGRPQRIRTQRVEELRELGLYMAAEFGAALTRYPGHPFRPAEAPGPGTLVLRLALIEAQPTNAAVNVLATVGGVLIPGTGLIRRFASGSIAVEGLLSDGEQGEALLEFKDRETDPWAPFTIKDFQEYAHIHATVREWARQFAEMTATGADHQVEEQVRITLDPL